MATTRIMPIHASDGKSILTTIKNSLNYGKNPNKTRDGKLISSYECNAKTAANEFILLKNQYEKITGRIQKGKHNILLYQIRQSFKPGEITPEEANRLAYELAIRFTKGNHAFLITTHEDKKHIHSHIYFNSTALNCTRKFKNFWGSSFAICTLNDQICIENGYSIIRNPKRSKGHYGTWLGDKKKPSNRDILRQDIDTVLSQKPKNFEEFLQFMKDTGYTIKLNKNVTFQNSKFKGNIRCNSLKSDYTEEAIKERIEGKRIVEPVKLKQNNSEKCKINLLIDIENSIKVKGSPGYEQWAKIFNLKQAAQTLIYLQENGLDEYEKLEKKVTETNSLYQEFLEKIKPIEKRLTEITDLQKHIGNYSKTKDIYTAYRKTGYSKKFLADHEKEIILHKSAKNAFNKLGLKKLPTFKMLKIEYAALKSEKNKLYSEYKKIKSEVKKLSTVKANTDRLLSYSNDTKYIKKEELYK